MSLQSWNVDQHIADKAEYGEELTQLYQLAHYSRGSTTSNEKRELAFNELLERFPDAYAAAKLIAERAFIPA